MFRITPDPLTQRSEGIFFQLSLCLDIIFFRYEQPSAHSCTVPKCEVKKGKKHLQGDNDPLEVMLPRHFRRTMKLPRQEPFRIPDSFPEPYIGPRTSRKSPFEPPPRPANNSLSVGLPLRGPSAATKACSERQANGLQDLARGVRPVEDDEKHRGHRGVGGHPSSDSSLSQAFREASFPSPPAVSSRHWSCECYARDRGNTQTAAPEEDVTVQVTAQVEVLRWH